jgi:flagellar motor switch protein FliN
VRPGPNFSPFPFRGLRKLTRREAAIESWLACWLAVRGPGGKLAALAGGPVQIRLLGCAPGAPDPHAAVAEVRCGGVAIAVTGSAQPVRALAQRLLGGPAELPAARPLGLAEHAIWALAVAAAAVDLGVAAEVWPLEPGRTPGVSQPSDPGDAPSIREPSASAEPIDPPDRIAIGFAVELPAALGAVMTVTASVPAAIAVRAPPARPLANWWFELAIAVARGAVPREAIAGLRAGDAITIEPGLELVIGVGGIGLSAAPGAVEARVATEYRARDMAVLDDATLEITVQLGTSRMSLRQIGELAIGQIVALGRPLAGPYEVHVAGRMVGHGELVDIDGELGVRIVSIADHGDPLP